MNSQEQYPITSRKPEEIIAFHSGEAVRVDQFLADAIAFSKRLPRHRYVINLLTDRYQYLLSFCASLIAGQCTLMPPNRLAKTLGQLVAEFPDSYTLGDTGLSFDEVFAAPHLDKTAGKSDAEAIKIPADQLSAIAFTSGSTGKPAPNLKNWQAVRAGGISNAGTLLNDLAGQVSLLATVPAQHMWGFETTIVMPLFARAAVSQLTPFYPQDIAEALESLCGSRVLISSPVHLDVLLRSGVALPELERIFCATAPLARDQAMKLEDRFNTRVIEVFGSSETGMLASRHTATESSWRLFELFELDAGKDGFMVRAQHLTEQVFLQDLIEITGERQFRWLGRHADMINIAGKRGSLADINTRLLAIDGVVDGVVFVPESNIARLAAMVVAPDLEPVDIIDKLRQEVDPAFLPRPICKVPALPRLETGKLALRDVMKLYDDISRNKPGH